MTQDERIDEALARLATALASLEAASYRVIGRQRTQSTDSTGPVGAIPTTGNGLAEALDQALARADRLEAATGEVTRVLKNVTETLAGILTESVEADGD